MQTLQQRTSRMVWNRLANARSGKAITLAAIGGTGFSRIARAQDSTPEAPFAEPVDVVNYALTLEHLEAAFYKGGEEFTDADFEALGFQTGVRDRVMLFGEHEATHVDALIAVVEQLDGEPVEAAEYDFGYTDLTSYLATAAVLEGVGVSAYGGAAQYLQGENELLTAALTIHGVEARHAAYLNILTAQSPFPDAFNAPLTPAEVLELATPFFVT